MHASFILDPHHTIMSLLWQDGTVTPHAQEGNPRPRIVRLTEDDALINRYNPSAGHAAVAHNLRAAVRRRPCGVNVGPNAGAADAEADFLAGVRALGPFADYIVVNVSNPTVAQDATHRGGSALTVMLRKLREEVKRLPSSGPHAGCSAHGSAHGSAPALILKVGPDLSAAQIEEVTREALTGRIDGLIVANASLKRPPSLRSPAAKGEVGGLTGAPLRENALALLETFYRALGGKVPLVGLGGIRTGRDAYSRIRAGASAVQLYTAFAYEGVALLPRIKRELAELLEADGFRCVADAVGADVSIPTNQGGIWRSGHYPLLERRWLPTQHGHN